MNGYINNRPVKIEKNETILATARRYGHFIPTLCEMEELNHAPGTCRVCLVMIQRKNSSEQYFVTSCNTPMEDGMKVFTRSEEVRRMQRLQVELLLADHNQDCAACIRHGNCELQDIAQFVGLQQTRYGNKKYYQERTRDFSSHSIVRDMSKCIRCFRCVTVCRQVQGTDILVVNNKGINAEVSTRRDLDLANSNCISCGQCTLVCPVGALAEKDDIEKVIDLLYNHELYTVFQFAPSVRIAIGEEFDLEPGQNMQGQMITALRNLGADLVLDTNFTADLVIMEEGTELLTRIKQNKTLPMFTSCSPGWINYIEKNYPEMLPHLSTVKSPQQSFGIMAKTYLAQKMNVDPKKMRVISIMPCTAKKDEAKREEFIHQNNPEVDHVLTTREFARLLKREGINLPKLEEGTYDNSFMGDFSGAAEIFGTTGGVMEAAIRTVHYLVTNKEIPGIEFKEIRGLEAIREATVNLGEKIGNINIAVAHGLKAAKKILQMIKAGEANYHFIEFMGCPGGCMNGGGQPRDKKHYQGNRIPRQKAIYNIDRTSTVRQSHNNPLIKKIYQEFLKTPGSSKAHKLLHTHYKNRKQELKYSIKEIWEDIQKE